LLQLQNAVMNTDETLCNEKGANLKEQFTEKLYENSLWGNRLTMGA